MSKPTTSSSPSPEKRFAYCLVARNGAILSDNPNNATLQSAARLCLDTLPKTGYKYAFLHETCRFNCLMEEGYAYLVMVDKALNKTLAFEFLEIVKSEFQKVLKIRDPPSQKSLRDFDKYLQAEMDKAEENLKVPEKTSNFQSQLLEVREVLLKNIDDVFHRVGGTGKS